VSQGRWMDDGMRGRSNRAGRGMPVARRGRASSRRQGGAKIGSRVLAVGAVLAVAACGGDARSSASVGGAAAGGKAGDGVQAAACAVVAQGVPLADGLRETSGIAESRKHPGVYWS